MSLDLGQLTVSLAVTPGGRPGDSRPLAKPGYKGKRKLSDYEREVAHALLRKGVRPKSRAIAMARGIIRNAATRGKWGKGKVRNPAVRAGAAASILQRKSFSRYVGEGGRILDMSSPQVLALALAEAGNRGIDLAALTAKKRKKLPKKAFAIPGKRAYPIHDKAHARNALARVSQHGSPAQKKRVRAAVKRKYPSVGMSLAVALAETQRRGLTLDLVGPKGYIHGWIKAGPGGVNAPMKGGKSRKRFVPAPSDSRPKGKTRSPKSAQELSDKYTTMRQNNHHAVDLIGPALDAAKAHRKEGKPAEAARFEGAAAQHAKDHINIFSKRKDSHGVSARAAEKKAVADPRVKNLLEKHGKPQQDTLPGSGKAEADAQRLKLARKEKDEAERVLNSSMSDSHDRARARRQLEIANTRIASLDKSAPKVKPTPSGIKGALSTRETSAPRSTPESDRLRSDLSAVTNRLASVNAEIKKATGQRKTDLMQTRKRIKAFQQELQRRINGK